SRLADRRGDPMPVHVGLEVRTDTREDHAHLLSRQIVEEIAQRARGGIVHIRYRARIDDEPAHRGRRMLYEHAHFVGEAMIVGVEQTGAETIDDEAGSVPAPGVVGAGSQWPSASGAQ